MKTNSLKLSLVLLGLVPCLTVFAQSKWVYSYGGGSQEEALCSDAVGEDYFVGGYFNQGFQLGGEALQSNGFGDAFLTKLDGDGNVDWVQSIGGTGSDRILDVAAHANGFVAATGFITGDVEVGGQNLSTNAGSQDAFVMLCDDQGNPVWTIPVGGEDADTGYGVSMDAEGNVYCTGQFKGQGQFGPYTLSSAENPLDNEASHDIFVMKIAPDGEVLWVKQGAASYDDRGLSMCNDPAGNVYVVGQSSDTLLFGNTSYPNDVFNSGFLLKIDTDGNEEWMTRLATFQTLINEIEYGSDDHLYLTGDHIGQMAVVSENTTQFFPSDNSYNLFLGKFNLNGDPVWLHSAGSENEVSSKSLCEGENGEWYIAGTFKCRFSSFSEPYGDGIFYSYGYRDIFVARYDGDGTRVWERNFGSPKDDFCAAVEYGAIDDPLFFGSYGSSLRFPHGPGFGESDDAEVPWWGYGINYCEQDSYGMIQSVQAQGGLDVFMARAVQAEMEPLDLFIRNGEVGCTRDFREVCINASACPDTVSACGEVNLSGAIFTSVFENGGPEIDVEWEGDVQPLSTFTVRSYNDQWVVFHIERADGCYTSQDSIYTVVHPYPDHALLSDDVVVNTECVNCSSIDLCEVQEVTFTASGVNEAEFGWVNPALPGETEFTTSEGGLYSFQQENEFGCARTTSINLEFAIPPDTVAPYISVVHSGMDIGLDSVGLCTYQSIAFLLLDSLNGFPGMNFDDGVVEWSQYFEGDMTAQSILPSENAFNINYVADGWYHIHASYTELHCEEATVTYPLLTDSLYVQVFPQPEATSDLNGESNLCPGGSVVWTASGSDNYGWSGPDFEQLAPDSIEVFSPGFYFVNFSETNEYGCVDYGNAVFYVASKLAHASMLPENGIVCPFDSVMLFTEDDYLSYQWIGPMGELLGNEQELWAQVPGLYHCQVMDEDSCYLETNFLEVKEYSSPYLEAFPGTDLCVNGAVELTLYTNEEAEVNWLNPFSGDDLEQLIEEPGTYSVQSTLCGITTALDITVVMTEVPAEINVVSELPVCPGDTVLLQANPGMSFYDWNPGGLQGPQLEVTESGVYNLTTVNAQGCLGFAEPVEIEFTEAIAEIAFLPESACPGETLLLEAEGTGNFSWFLLGEEEAVAEGASFEILMTDEAISIGVSSAVSTCESLLEFNELLVHPSAWPLEIEAESSYCAGDEISLLSSSGELDWSGPAGTFTGEEWLLGPASPAWSGVYVADYADNQCGALPDSLAFVVYIPEQVSLSMENDSICEGEESTLTASQLFDDMLWMPLNTPGLTVNVGGTGAYWVEALDSNGCPVISDTLYLTVNALPATPPAIDTLACAGTDVSLNSTYAGETLWYNPFSGDSISAPNISFASLESDVASWYQYISENGCASESASIFVHVPFAGEDVSINAPEWVCEGSDLTFSTALIADEYLWIYPDDVVEGGFAITFEDVDAGMSGNYELVVSLGPCVLSSGESYVEVIELPESLIDEERFDCIGGTIVMQAPSGLVDPLWNGSFEGAVYELQEPGWHYLEGMIEPGCFVVDSVYFETIDCEGEQANIFTPNNDGINDRFNFRGWSHRIAYVRIFNRWGNLVKEIDSAPFVWDGTNSQSQPVEAGVYYIVLQSEVEVQGESTLTGQVHLKR